jgi:hypothetical protein
MSSKILLDIFIRFVIILKTKIGELHMKTTWRVLDKDEKIVFIGKHGWYNEAQEYIDAHKDNKDLKIDPESK